jgi:hypothetical protein
LYVAPFLVRFRTGFQNSPLQVVYTPVRKDTDGLNIHSCNGGLRGRCMQTPWCKGCAGVGAAIAGE